MQQFYVFNRKFTQEEMAQFKFNKKLKFRGKKMYHYNPQVHGNEKEHQERHEAWNQGQKFLGVESKRVIELENL